MYRGMSIVRILGSTRPPNRARSCRPDRQRRLRRMLTVPLLALVLQFGAATTTAPAALEGAAWSATGINPDATGVLVILGIRG